MKLFFPFFVLFLPTLWSCTNSKTESNVEPPGNEKTSKTKMLETGANLLQDKAPLNQMTTYLDGFHFLNGNMNEQMEAHHYVSKINEDLSQAIIFDGNDRHAKIMGIEYIISEKLFKKLPNEEKKYWHSHVYEVKSGELIAPGIPNSAEHELMNLLVSTYGKTFHTWQTHRNDLPLGIPQLMMGFTADGQLDQELINDRDKRFSISTAEKRQQREDIPLPYIEKEADSWKDGKIIQLKAADKKNQ